ncbi:MAG TPA: flagellar biosynthetic protein FliR [Thermoanaerobaculia bacterium]|nr:flagellar biosynthetic protein FliR [Thermoanaerobaculia bacterium]
MSAPATLYDAFFSTLTAELGVRHNAFDTVSLFTLGLARWLPVAALAPFLGGRLVPAVVRIGFGFLFALVLLPSLSAAAPVPLAFSTPVWWALVLKELAIGVTLGFAASLPFFAAEMAGQAIDAARGTTVANLIVPQTRLQSSILGDFYHQLFIVLYFLGGGHRFFLEAALDANRLLPPLVPGLELGLAAYSFIDQTAMMLSIALRIIAPALVVVILLDVVLGVANRMAPQLDVFFMSLPLKSALSALVIGLSVYGLIDVANEYFEGHHRWFLATTERIAIETGTAAK